jgi:predicted flap endonuclease-1-like 5' DNA nuclease
MQTDEFRAFLKAERRSPGTIEAHIESISLFAAFLKEKSEDADIDAATPEDIGLFVEQAEGQGLSKKKLLWSLHNYYGFSDRKTLYSHALALRLEAMQGEKKSRPGPLLSTLHGASSDAVTALAKRGIANAKSLLQRAATQADRTQLASTSGAPIEDIEELASYADLSRITDIKGKRGRLLLEAGICSVQQLRLWDPEELLSHLTDVVEATGLLQRPPTPAESRYWIKQAKELPDIVEEIEPPA